jgi:coatomer subunit beta'
LCIRRSLLIIDTSGLKKLALQVSQDQDHKFDLAISVDDLKTALSIAETVPSGEADIKWKTLGDRALALWQFDLARRCYEESNDLSTLMLLLLSMGDRPGLEKLALSAGKSIETSNIRWLNVVQSRKAKITSPLLLSCSLEIPKHVLTYSSRLGVLQKPLFSLAHMHLGKTLSLSNLKVSWLFLSSQVSKAVSAWKTDLEAQGKGKIAAQIASPEEHEDMFGGDWKGSLARESAASKASLNGIHS